MSEGPWTLEQLGARVREALASDYVPPGSARVRAVPDPRTIRYYTTLGLLDRPELRGRTALYGERHLLQLVAIKRLQAEGLSLTQVQERLAGLPTERLRELARLSSHEVAASTVVTALPHAVDTPAVDAPTPSPGRRDFWRALPDAAAPDVTSDDEVASHVAIEGPIDEDPPGVSRLTRVELAPGVTILLGALRRMNHEDVEAIRHAAGPLLRALEDRGLQPGQPARHDEEESDR